MFSGFEKRTNKKALNRRILGLLSQFRKKPFHQRPQVTSLCITRSDKRALSDRDGYYESQITGIEGNQIEFTI